MRTRVVETLARWDAGAVRHYGRGRTYQVQACDWGTLERIAHHAIGCDARDLRDSELVEVRAMVAELVSARFVGAVAS